VLLALRDFIQHHQVVSLEQLTREFRIAPEALVPILSIWMNKSVIRRAIDKEGCGTTCQSCRPKQLTYYEWC